MTWSLAVTVDGYHECGPCECQGGNEVQHWKIVDGSIPTYRDGEGVNLGGCVFLVILCMFVGGAWEESQKGSQSISELGICCTWGGGSSCSWIVQGLQCWGKYFCAVAALWG
jgi:hypothetical protein